MGVGVQSAPRIAALDGSRGSESTSFADSGFVVGVEDRLGPFELGRL